jgi:hypothetical protein
MRAVSILLCLPIPSLTAVFTTVYACAGGAGADACAWFADIGNVKDIAANDKQKFDIFT